MSKAYYFSGCEKTKKISTQNFIPSKKKIPLNEEEINIFSNDGKENLSPADLP